MLVVRDVGPRDGLQNEKEVLLPALRAELIDRLADSGVTRIESVSFVRADRVPQMADAEEVARLIRRRGSVSYSGLVLNKAGYVRLAAAGLAEVNFVFAATETFNRRNQNSSVADSLATALSVINLAREDRRKVNVTIGVAFGCPFEGRIDPGRVLEYVRQLVAQGADSITLADTVGIAVPREVRKLIGESVRCGASVGAHLHNTRSLGFVNAYVALEAGATSLDASVGGIGGCPFAPLSSGNIATEDLVHLLDGEGIETGIDLDKIVFVANWLEGILGRELPGRVHLCNGRSQPKDRVVVLRTAEA